jgi:hypothetical protein
MSLSLPGIIERGTSVIFKGKGDLGQLGVWFGEDEGFGDRRETIECSADVGLDLGLSSRYVRVRFPYNGRSCEARKKRE